MSETEWVMELPLMAQNEHHFVLIQRRDIIEVQSQVSEWFDKFVTQQLLHFNA